MKLPILDITPFTLQDFPDVSSCILWFGGCNFECKYCHNPEFIRGKKSKIAIEEVWDFLEKRKGLLDGVVLSGGECTLSKNLKPFAKELKEMGYMVKLDTNGSNPDVLLDLCENNLIDYVAIDYKAPKDKLEDITSWSNFSQFETSLVYLCHHDIPFEVRTTVHTDLLDENDIHFIMEDLETKGFDGMFYVQNFIKNSNLLTDIGDQKRILDIDNLKAPKNFTIGFRNF